jgi:hypothetical protein
MIIEPKKPELDCLSLPFDRKQMPREIQALHVDKRGYPIPWFVDRQADVDGEPDFRIMSAYKLSRCVKEKLCWICGQKLGVTMCFPIGPMCGVNRTNAEPPSHPHCAMWSVRACPFLSQPKRIRREGGQAEKGEMAGSGVMRNPGVTLLWHCESYKIFRVENGLLFTIGDPLMVQWVREGRQATREEVLESLTGGIPILLERAAEHDGAPGCFELGRQVERFMQYVPAPPAAPDLIVPKKGLIIQ